MGKLSKISKRRDLNKLIDKGVKLKDVLQPYNPDGSENYDYQSVYKQKDGSGCE